MSEGSEEDDELTIPASDSSDDSDSEGDLDEAASLASSVAELSSGTLACIQHAKYTIDYVPLLLFLFLLLFRSSLILPLSSPLLFLVFLLPPTPTRDQPQAAAGRPAREGSAKPLHHEATVRGEDATLAAPDTLSRVRERQSPERDK